MARKGHVPLRMCMGCGRRFAKDAVVRFTAREHDGGRVVVLDTTGTAAGRGAYVCPAAECYDRAVDRRALMRRLGAKSEHPLLREDFIHMLETRR